MAAEVKKFTRKEVSSTSDPKNNPQFIIYNKVYNVAKFLDEHPGGHEVLVNVVGKDASEDFEDIGHSLDAKELMKKYQVGELVDEDKREVKAPSVSWTPAGSSEEAEQTSFLSSWKFPVVLGILVTVLYSYLFG